MPYLRELVSILTGKPFKRFSCDPNDPWLKMQIIAEYYHRFMLEAALHMNSCVYWAEDVVQDVNCKLLHNLNQVSGFTTVPEEERAMRYNIARLKKRSLLKVRITKPFEPPRRETWIPLRLIVRKNWLSR